MVRINQLVGLLGTILLWQPGVPITLGAEFTDDALLADEIRLARVRLQEQQPSLPSSELDRLAQSVGRSNVLARAIENAFQHNDLIGAARWLEQFTGNLDDLRSFGDPLLLRAVLDGGEAQVNFLLERKANPSQVSQYGNTPLCAALEFGQLKMAARLIEAGASVTQTNAQGRSPLGLLIAHWLPGRRDDATRLQLLERLLEYGADPFAPFGTNDARSVLEVGLSKDTRGLPALTNAWAVTARLIGHLMLTNRPSPNRHTPHGDTALHLAPLWDRAEAVDVLLGAGFSVNQKNSRGLTPLQSVAEKLALPLAINRSSVKLLISRGAILDACAAAGLGWKNKLTEILRTDPARVNERDPLGRTPLHYAVASAQVSLVELLLSVAGVDTSIATTQAITSIDSWRACNAGSTPLHIAAAMGHARILQLLLRANAAVNKQDAEGNLPLHLAAALAEPEYAAALLQARSPVNWTNRVGWTPLRVAVENSVPANVDLLLRSGARPDIGLLNNTLLHMAATRGSTDVAQALLRHGLSIDARDAGQNTPFQLAVRFRNWDMLNLLQNAGANVNAQDADGNTALHRISSEANDTAQHLAEPPFWVRWQRAAMSRPGLSQRAVQQLVQWKVISPLPASPWTNSSLTAWLLDHNANANLTNNHGQTPLHLLCSSPWIGGNDNLATNRVTLLLRHGARTDIMDAQGVTSLDLAKKYASTAVISVMSSSAVKRNSP